MSKDNNGGPAFPRPISQHDPTKQGQPIPAHDGMTLRDWFAGDALPAIIASLPKEIIQRAGTHGYRERNAEIAQWVYDIADAMIKQRDK